MLFQFSMQNLNSQVWFLFLMGLMGMAAHFLIKYRDMKHDIGAENPLHGFILYFFKQDVINTLITVMGLVAGFFIMYQSNSVSVYAAILTGYGADSFFNKAGERR